MLRSVVLSIKLSTVLCHQLHYAYYRLKKNQACASLFLTDAIHIAQLKDLICLPTEFVTSGIFWSTFLVRLSEQVDDWLKD